MSTVCTSAVISVYIVRVRSPTSQVYSLSRDLVRKKGGVQWGFSVQKSWGLEWGLQWGLECSLGWGSKRSWGLEWGLQWGLEWSLGWGSKSWGLEWGLHWGVEWALRRGPYCRCSRRKSQRQSSVPPNQLIYPMPLSHIFYVADDRGTVPRFLLASYTVGHTC